MKKKKKHPILRFKTNRDEVLELSQLSNRGKRADVQFIAFHSVFRRVHSTFGTSLSGVFQASFAHEIHFFFHFVAKLIFLQTFIMLDKKLIFTFCVLGTLFSCKTRQSTMTVRKLICEDNNVNKLKYIKVSLNKLKIKARNRFYAT